MKKFVLHILLLCSFNVYAQDRGENIEAGADTSGAIRYGIDKSYEPYEFVDEQGNAAGFNVDLIKEIGKELGKEVIIIPDTWKNTRKSLEQTGKVNVAAYFKWAGRREKVIYSQPMSLVYYTIFSRANKVPIEGLFGLDGKRVAIQEYSIVDDYFQQLAFLDTTNIKRYASEPEAIQAVIDGKQIVQLPLS